MDLDRNGVDKVGDDVILPGFRFHPTDEELVGFYLRRKVQQRSLSIELIKELDIYKFDPWDLPKIASMGEKEWYFYCPRDRKYRNSARPNRVTSGGFWKATGTDRPIYSSTGGSICIGLKKSLVFYRGRAAKGLKTDWMMHEFRLPSIVDPSPSKRLLDKGYPTNDAWAICRIFKKTSSIAQRALSQQCVSPFPETTPFMNLPHHPNMTFLCNNGFQSQKPSLSPNPVMDLPFIFSPSMALDQQASESISFGGSHDQFSDLFNQQDKNRHDGGDDDNDDWSMGFSFSLPWDSPESDVSTNKCDVGL